VKGPPSRGTPGLHLWRVFPYDASARDGDSYSVRSVAPAHRQTGGRFDLGIAPVLYLAESPFHAVAEVLRRFSGRALDAELLQSTVHPLALVAVHVPSSIAARLVDLADPEVLVRFGIRPDTLALPEASRAQTQAVSRRIYDAGLAGFRWWSAIHGGWHSTVLFVDRAPLGSLGFGQPEVLAIDHPAVVGAAPYLYLRQREP
jgi:RES domain-containing protein